MTITPDELRNVMFRESLRGYHRAEVDAVCERAAETIEHLEHQVRVLRTGGALVEPVESVRIVRTGGRGPVQVDDDTIQRTLILAQRAADQAVNDARERAAKLTAESEAKAHSLVAEAQATARHIGEQERCRIEAEVERLHAARASLSTDVEALERFTTEFRARIRRAIEGELNRLDDPATVDAPPPARSTDENGDELVETRT